MHVSSCSLCRLLRLNPLLRRRRRRRVQEYRSAAHALQACTDPLSLFMRCYATYLAGEKQKE